MKILQTEVTRVTSASGRPILRVRFCGEGDDCVTVDMGDVEESSDASIIDYAKTILAQTTTFDAAANEYDARSNGNFDEVAVTAVTDEHAGMYIFEYRDGEVAGRFYLRKCLAWKRHKVKRYEVSISPEIGR